jgi:lipopolysaccharide/colanic/teichoic acid biosynthesis glycosyltransferase
MLKRTFDIVLAALGLLVWFPVAAVIALLVKLTDGGPVFYNQPRVGRDGRVFVAYKFRSMVPDAERETGPVRAAVNDPRVTPVGRVLRATALDELPQLWNILRGDMSFVGPRPLRPGEADARDDRVVPLSAIAGYDARHRVRPGLTGLAQVHASRHLSRAGKFRLDLLYVKRMSFWLDLSLIARSIAMTLRARWEQPMIDRRARRWPL